MFTGRFVYVTTWYVFITLLLRCNVRGFEFHVWF